MVEKISFTFPRTLLKRMVSNQNDCLTLTVELLHEQAIIIKLKG